LLIFIYGSKLNHLSSMNLSDNGNCISFLSIYQAVDRAKVKVLYE
jgi:hypothetical protein